MPHADPEALWPAVQAAGGLGERGLWGAGAHVPLGALEEGSSLGGRREELRGRSVLVATGDQLTAALALLELDGVARRLVLAPPDLAGAEVGFVVATAEVEALVTDGAAPAGSAPGVGVVVPCSARLTPAAEARRGGPATEWILLTSGTTGRPKLVVHTLGSLAGALGGGRPVGAPAVWSTFYDIRRYGGLQIFLRALLGGGSLVLSSAEEAIGDFLLRAAAHGVTHLTGTPSHWRRALMSPAARRLAPHYVRLSGEIADQAILDHLRACYPTARIVHAFASTEAGVGFEVGDGRAGFPASLLGAPQGGVELKVVDGSLRIRSARTATRYLGDAEAALADGAGFVDTGDMVEPRGDRYYFVGRRGGIINVGGLKVYPEEVEAVINDHPHVRMARVRPRRNALTGALVVADVVLHAGPEAANGARAALAAEILGLCRARLPRHKVPVAIHFVPALPVAPTGKLVRPHA